MNNCHECELRRDSKSHCGGGDRLSSLPLPILYHILTFLGIKESVRTSVLSRTWRSVWKYLPVLHFDRDDFRTNTTFAAVMKKVLKLRYHSDVEKITYECFASNMKQKEWQDTAVKYALAHNAQHLHILCHDTYSRLFGSLIGQSFSRLSILSLEGIDLDAGFGASRFPVLSSLDLRDCKFRSSTAQDNQFLDPFSEFPHLTNLEIYGLQLIVTTSLFKFKISAPNLESLVLECTLQHHLKFFAPPVLPCLVRADVYVNSDTSTSFAEQDMESAAKNLITLFQSFCNVESLKLYSTTIETLNMISGHLKEETSPFRRLKNLSVSSSLEDCKPHEAVKSFFNGFV